MEPVPAGRSRLRLLEALRHRDFKLLFARRTSTFLYLLGLADPRIRKVD